MGICPRCGSWVDEGEPYCPECGYDGSEESGSARSIFDDCEEIRVNGWRYDRSDVEDALEQMGYDWDDFESGYVDEDELERVLEDM